MMTHDERAKIEREIKEQILAQKRIYDAEWRKKNPDKVREKNARYYKKHKAERAEHYRQRRVAQCTEGGNKDGSAEH